MIFSFMGTQEDAKQCVQWMKTLMAGLNLTYNWSNKELTFFHIKLIAPEEGILETDKFVKPTNSQIFLLVKSNHTQAYLKPIVYGQTITVKKFTER